MSAIRRPIVVYPVVSGSSRMQSLPYSASGFKLEKFTSKSTGSPKIKVCAGGNDPLPSLNETVTLQIIFMFIMIITGYLDLSL